MAQTPVRSKFDEQTKQETVRRILAGEVTVQDAAEKHGIQSYQLHAWIGYVVVELAAAERKSPAAVVRELAGTSDTPPSSIPNGLPTGSTEKAVLEWYLRKYVLRP